MKIENIYINPPFIKLEQFLKFAGAVSTGGEAKNIIFDGLVTVNDDICLMRGKKLFGGETVKVNEYSYICSVRSEALE